MKRKDAYQVFDIPEYKKIFPFVMDKRNESVVYHEFELDFTNTVRFIRQYNKDKPDTKMKIFYVFATALLRTFALRPEMNRFIMARRYWERKDLTLNFVVKESFEDNARETSNPINFEPDMTLPEFGKIMDDYIEESRKPLVGENSTDRAVSFFLNFPYWLLGFIVKIIKFLDHRGMTPLALNEADGLHSSVFISNLGSIGILGGSPHHHVYEWGSTSVFITMGSLQRHREFDDNGKLISSKETVKIGVSLDERIADGLYFVKSMFLLQDFIEHPEKLMVKPENLPPKPITKKEYKKKKKADQKALKIASTPKN